jgi:type IV pilus assembly protein PilN
MFPVNTWMKNRITNLEAAKRSKEQINRDLLAQVRKVRELENAIASVGAKITAIRDIREEQGLTVQFIDAVLSAIPESKLWFENFALNRGGSIQVKGVSLDNQAFADFVELLRKSPYIVQIQTKGTSKKEIQGLGLVQFDCLIVAGKPSEQEGQDG